MLRNTFHRLGQMSADPLIHGDGQRIHDRRRTSCMTTVRRLADSARQPVVLRREIPMPLLQCGKNPTSMRTNALSLRCAVFALAAKMTGYGQRGRKHQSEEM